MTPYYQDASVTIYHGDCREVSAWLYADVMLSDPPYGIAYRSGMKGALPRSIAGDADTTARDQALRDWSPKPALIFGTWKRPAPDGTRMMLVWDTKGALGMGDLSIPWKPAHQQVYVIGTGFSGPRTTDVLSFAPVQSTAANGRTHPHEKPVTLLQHLLGKCPTGVVADPFMGSGSTLVAAKSLGRRAIGIEIDERYCEIAAQRCSGAAKRRLNWGPHDEY